MIAVGEEQHPVGDRRRARVVGHHHDRLPEVARPSGGAARGSRRPSVESRLPVGSSAKTTVGSRDERARDRDALLLAAGELGRPVREAIGEPDRRDQLVEPRACRA